MSTAQATVTGTTVLIGRCVICKRAHRVELPAALATRYAHVLGQAMQKAGVSAWCDCRAGVPCETDRWGYPKCGLDECHGHTQTAVNFKQIKVTYRPQMSCGSACWSAKGDSCACSCRAENHGRGWAASA